MKRLHEDGGFIFEGFPSKFNRRARPCAARDFPVNCGTPKLNLKTSSLVNCSSKVEISSSDYIEEFGSLVSENNGGRTEGFNNMEKPKSLDITEAMVNQNEQQLSPLKAAWETALQRVAEIIALTRQKALKEAQETAGEGVMAKNLNEGVNETNLDKNVSDNGGEGGLDMNSRIIRRKDNNGSELEWEDVGDDVYVLTSKALMVENHTKFNGFGGGVVGSQGTVVVCFDNDDSDGGTSVSDKSGKDCGENWQEPKVLDVDQCEVEKEQDTSTDNFTSGNLVCVEFKERYNDRFKNYQKWDELVNMDIVKRDQPDGYKVREALMKFEEFFKELQNEQKERKAEMGEVQNGKNYPHIEAWKRVKAEGMCISVRKPFGHIPGIEIGDTFQFRSQLVVLGLHHQMMCGIDYVTIGNEKFATCVVDSGRYENEARTCDSFIYSGSGGNPKLVEKATDQKLEKGNLALVNSMEKRYPVRVICKRKTEMSSSYSYDVKHVYEYEGLYVVTRFWQERDENGRLVFKFGLIRLPDQPRPRLAVAKSRKLLPRKENTIMGSKSQNGKLLPWKENTVIGYKSQNGKLLLRKENTIIGSKSQKMLHRKEICIIGDISEGQENRPIRVMNGIDDLRPPPFTYISKTIYPDWCKRVEPIGCNCINGCLDSHQCPCVVRNEGEIPFNETGSIVRSRSVIYECSVNCKCPPSCHNRVSQHGPRFQLEIFKTTEREWGLRSRGYVTSGSFICEYIGELLRDKEAEQRIDEDEYLFDIGDDHEEDAELESLYDSRKHDAFAINAGKFGNVGRFVNHSCSPNMYAQEVLYDHHDKKMPHIMFFSTKNIPPLQELTYNYNYKTDRVCDVNGNIKKKQCFCGSRNCTGRMY